MNETSDKTLLHRAELLADWIERDALLSVQENVPVIRDGDAAYVSCLMQVPWEEEDLPWNSGNV